MSFRIVIGCVNYTSSLIRSLSDLRQRKGDNMDKVLGILAGAALSAAFVFPKPACYAFAIVCAAAVSLLRFFF
jgi:hypothetical protein